MTIENYHKGQKDERPWGTWEVIETSSTYIVKTITVKPGHRLSLQYHNHRSEHWIIVEGTGIVTLSGDAIPVERGRHIFVPVKAEHRIENSDTENLTFIEIQSGDVLDETDIVRIEDDYKR